MPGKLWQVTNSLRPSATGAADPDQRSACERQLAPAHLAARWGHPAVLQALRQHGANLEARCAGLSWTPLQEAGEWRRGSCVSLLQGDGLVTE